MACYFKNFGFVFYNYFFRIKPLRKTSVKRGNISNEVCARVDSSGGEFFSGLSDCRRNSALFNSVDKPTSEDHVEIDFGIFIL